MSAFYEIFNIRLYHSFYEDAICYGLKILPDSRTATILKNARAIFRNQPNGICVAHDSGFISALEAFRNEDTYLLFKICLIDEYFYNYTDLLHRHDKILYFDFSKATKKENEFLLSLKAEVSEEDQVDLSTLNFSKAEKIVPPFGLIKINLKDIIEENYSPETLNTINISIRFRSKSTFWRYKLIDTNNNQFEELYIIDNNKQVSFAAFERMTMSSGQPFAQITSSQPVSLQEKSKNHFRFVGKKDNQEKLIINKLGYPDYKHIIKENDKIITETYVYY